METTPPLHPNFMLRRHLAECIVRILRPLARILLRLNVSCYAVTELVRWVYVDVAMSEDEFARPFWNPMPSKARTSYLTGLSRREVGRLLAMAATPMAPTLPNYSRHGRVITGWLSDDRYLDAQGKPKLLPIKSSKGLSFQGLTIDFGGDVPYSTIFNDFYHRGWIKADEDDQFKLMKLAYTRKKDPQTDKKLEKIAKQSEELLTQGAEKIPKNSFPY